MRRDAYAAHVRAKHMKEIALLMLKDFKENNVNTISAHASDKSIKSMVIESVKYQDAEYWFGVKPLFYIRESNEVPYDPTRPDTKCKAYPEDLELAQYLKRDENLASHKNFIEECFKELSYFDFMNQQKHLVFRDASVVTMKNELLSLKKEHEALKDITHRERERLQKEIEMWKETADEKEFIADLKKDVYHYKAQSSRLQRELDSEKRKLQEVDKIWEERWTEFNQSRYSELRQAEEINDILRKENEKLKGKVKEEAQKLFDKERKDKEKIKAKKILEKEKAKKAAKKAKKLAEMTDSESESSDSDSE
jgi:hypothetical protein